MPLFSPSIAFISLFLLWTNPSCLFFECLVFLFNSFSFFFILLSFLGSGGPMALASGGFNISGSSIGGSKKDFSILLSSWYGLSSSIGARFVGCGGLCWRGPVGQGLGGGISGLRGEGIASSRLICSGCLGLSGLNLTDCCCGGTGFLGRGMSFLGVLISFLGGGMGLWVQELVWA